MKNELRRPLIAAHSGPDLWARRHVIATFLASAAAACAGVHKSAPVSQSLPVQGSRSYSESIQVSLADAAGTNFLSIRLCQYPDAEIAWIWAALLIDGEFIQVADNAVPWRGANSVEPGANQAAYTATSGTVALSFIRSGPMAKPGLGKMQFERAADPNVRASVTFHPAELFEGLIPGRAEVFGLASAEVVVRGKTIKFDGPGQWHEQPQTDARFVTPFVYASLWGDGVFATILQTPEMSGGYIIHPGGVANFVDAGFDPTGPSRAVRVTDPGGAVSEFPLQTKHRYGIKIYDEYWSGSFVSGHLLGIQVSGFLNSWRY